MVAGTIGVAGLAYYLYRRSRGAAEMYPDNAAPAPMDAANEEEDEDAGV